MGSKVRFDDDVRSYSYDDEDYEDRNEDKKNRDKNLRDKKRNKNRKKWE